MHKNKGNRWESLDKSFSHCVQYRPKESIRKVNGNTLIMEEKL